jgi:hypothetical protein
MKRAFSIALIVISCLIICLLALEQTVLLEGISVTVIITTAATAVFETKERIAIRLSFHSETVEKKNHKSKKYRLVFEAEKMISEKTVDGRRPRRLFLLGNPIGRKFHS